MPNQLTQEVTTALIIPTYNAGQYIAPLFAGVALQSLQPDHILVIDSSSTDNTHALLTHYPVQIHTIAQKDFDHSGTRRLATELIDADIYIFLTQDAIPATKETFANLVNGLMSDEDIGCAYGRQLPHADANPLSIHARLFNYPTQSQVKCYADKHSLGIKTCFNSDSFSAYKKSALQAVLGFPQKLFICEDVYVAAKMLQKGKMIYYAADACVYHSHNFNLQQEFQRYFAIGTFHNREFWILAEFGVANREGFSFIRSEIAYLIKNKKYTWILRAIAATFAKFFGYKLGLNVNKLPPFVKKVFGISPATIN